MVLIRNSEENSKQPVTKSRPGTGCAVCGKAVYFPVILADQPQHPHYHPACAAKIAQALMGDVMQLLLNP